VPQTLIPIIAALLALAVSVTVFARFAAARDRRLIREDLHHRRCRLNRARWAMTRSRPGIGRAYDVEYVDPEDDPAQATCTVARGAVSWGDDFAEHQPGKSIFARDLPTYGQNWRG
jgi:hypothetical protein